MSGNPFSSVQLYLGYQCKLIVISKNECRIILRSDVTTNYLHIARHFWLSLLEKLFTKNVFLCLILNLN